MTISQRNKNNQALQKTKNRGGTASYSSAAFKKEVDQKRPRLFLNLLLHPNPLLLRPFLLDRPTSPLPLPPPPPGPPSNSEEEGSLELHLGRNLTPSRLVHPLAAVILPVSLSIFLSLVLSICLCRSQRWRHRRCRLHQDREQFVEVDPSGRFGRYSDLLGAGAVKKVYRGFDQEEGRDVAWNQVKLRSFSGDPSVLKRLFSVPVKFSSGLQGRGICPQIISCDRTWMNKAKKQKKSQQIHQKEEESIDSKRSGEYLFRCTHKQEEDPADDEHYNELCGEIQEETQVLVSSSSSQTCVNEATVFEKVLGPRRGRIRGIVIKHSTMPTSSQYYEGHPQTSQETQVFK
ncbi:hypothetical protein LXL04_008363 [Taraxacum kok-saghyz]